MTAYGAVLRHPGLRVLLAAVAVSAVGDGMSQVSVAWLVLHLAPAGTAALWVAVCAAALVLPGTVLTLVRRRSFPPDAAVRVGTADAALHALGLGAVPLAAATGVLDVRLLPALLAVSSLLSTYGVAARYTLVAAALADDDRLAGNAAMSALAQTGVLLGPAAAGLVFVTWGSGTTGAVVAVGLDAASFAVLAVAYRCAAPHASVPPAVSPPPEPGPAPSASEGDGSPVVPRVVMRVVLLTAVFYGLYGPVEVGLPLRVSADWQGPAALLAAFVSAFGVGALLGGAAAGLLGSVQPWRLVPLIPVGWGVGLLPLALGAPPVVALVAFGAGAFVLGPYFAVTTTLVQHVTPAALLPHVLARRQMYLGLASPLGLVLGGALVQTVGARSGILVSAVLTVALGLAAVRLARGAEEDLSDVKQGVP